MNDNIKILATTKANSYHRAAGGSGPAPDALIEKVAAELEAELAAAPQARQTPPLKTTNGLLPGDDRAVHQTSGHLAMFRDQFGNNVPVLSRSMNLADMTAHRSGMTLGDLGGALAASATGNTSKYKAELRALRAQSEGVNTSGGVLVSDELSGMVIDAARAKSRLIEAGMMTIPMGSDVLTIARVTGDPTLSVTGENVALSEGNITFDAVQLTARKLGCYVPASRELLEDAGNASDLIVSTLTTAIAQEIDKLVLTGAGGSVGWLGLEHDPTIDVTDASTGALVYDDVLLAMSRVRGNNFEPKTLLMHPDKFYDLSILKTSTELQYLTPPAAWADLQKLDTTKLTDVAILGDFSKVILGIRSDIAIEFSTQAGDSFVKHQGWFKVVFRGAGGVMQPLALTRLEGIS